MPGLNPGPFPTYLLKHGKSFNFSGPQLLHLLNGNDNNITYFIRLLQGLNECSE